MAEVAGENERGLTIAHLLSVALTGHLLSILAMIRSAIEIASAMVDSKNGEGRPSHCASLRAARIEAAIRRTRLRPSSSSYL